jgi:hypothetical protein
MHTENVRSNEMFYCFASPYKDAECMHPVKKKKSTFLWSITEATQEWRKETNFTPQPLAPAQNVPQAGS